MNLFEIFYDSGLTFKHCLDNGPGAIREALYGCSEEEIRKMAIKQMCFASKELNGLNQEGVTAAIIDKVVKVASYGREFGDY